MPRSKQRMYVEHDTHILLTLNPLRLKLCRRKYRNVVYFSCGGQIQKFVLTIAKGSSNIRRPTELYIYIYIYSYTDIIYIYIYIYI